MRRTTNPYIIPNCRHRLMLELIRNHRNIIVGNVGALAFSRYRCKQVRCSSLIPVNSIPLPVASALRTVPQNVNFLWSVQRTMDTTVPTVRAEVNVM